MSELINLLSIIVPVALKVTDRSGASTTTSMTVNVNLMNVPMDVVSGSTKNGVSLKGGSLLDVAMYDTSSFDVKSINPATVTFGATGTETTPVKVVYKDINKDGKLDVLFYFYSNKCGFSLLSKTAIMKSLTTSGSAFLGQDSVVAK